MLLHRLRKLSIAEVSRKIILQLLPSNRICWSPLSRKSGPPVFSNGGRGSSWIYEFTKITFSPWFHEKMILELLASNWNGKTGPLVFSNGDRGFVTSLRNWNFAMVSWKIILQLLTSDRNRKTGLPVFSIRDRGSSRVYKIEISSWLHGKSCCSFWPQTEFAELLSHENRVSSLFKRRLQ